MGYEHGDVISSILYGMFFDEKNEEEEIVEKFLPKLNELAREGNLYAEYTPSFVSSHNNGIAISVSKLQKALLAFSNFALLFVHPDCIYPSAIYESIQVILLILQSQ